MLSFTDFEMVCRLHVQDDINRCFCSKQSDDRKTVLCNKFNCHFYKNKQKGVIR